jgi:ubiquinol-cytochrome c reductase cytochrome c1 subunit
MSTMKTLLAASILAAGACVNVTGAHAAGAAVDLLQKSWPHSGVFGAFDKAAAQRGFQIYREVCASCHSLKYVAFRNLEDLGFSEDGVKALAAEYTVIDGPDDEGEMIERPGKPFDYLPSPYPNENAARAANGGAYPPDLSLITKARADGTNYIYSLLLGYSDEPPADVELGEGMNYNAYFPGHQIAMAQPLYEDAVEYVDGTATTLEQHASDVATFLTWTAEPKLEERKGMGLKVMIFLVILTGLFYATKRKIWSDLH